VGSEAHDPVDAAVVTIVWSDDVLAGTLVPFTLDVVVTIDPALVVVSPVKGGSWDAVSEPAMSPNAGWIEFGIPVVEMELIHW